MSDEQHNVDLIGISYKTAPLDILEKLALTPEEIRDFYAQVEADPHLSDALVISTCNRTEVYALGDAQTGQAVSDLLRRVAGEERFPDPKYLYNMSGRRTLEHLFRVSCGLDSLVLGEAQILGQVKEAYEVACDHQDHSGYFQKVVQSALKVGRRSRADTEIGRGAVSVASAAVHLATRIYSDLTRRTVVIIGAGETGRLAAQHFSKHDPGAILITNRTFERAQILAQELGGQARTFDQLVPLITAADVVACAVSTTEPLLTKDLVERAIHGRTGRTLAILDLGLPRNVQPSVNDLHNVFVHDIEALKQVVDQNLSKRRTEMPRVEAIIQRAVDSLLASQRTAKAGPLIAALRDSVEGMRKAEVDKACQGLSDAERQAVERATRAIVNKLLHGPTTAIKSYARNQEAGNDQLGAIRAIFGNLDLDDLDE